MKTLMILTLFVASALSHASEIQLSKGIKSEQRSIIDRDMDVLDNLNFDSSVDERALKVMDLTTINAITAKEWLNTRIKYFIEENALGPLKRLLKNTIQVEKSGVTFPNQGILPYSLETIQENTQNKTPVTSNRENSIVVMSNIGAGLYSSGKREGKVYSIQVSQGLFKKPTKVVIESPRAGIIQIGEGLFMYERTVNNNNPSSIANSINRLAAFFHEAKHSDGNASSLGFAHSPCPAGHYLAGAYACDENENGPYKVGAIMTKLMLKSCEETCTPREKEVLKILILDSENRILHTTRRGTPATDWDSTPESL